MRGYYYYVVIVGVGVAWLVTEGMGMVISDLLKIFFLLFVFAKFTELEAYAHTHRLYAPGLNTPISSTNAQSIVELPGIDDNSSIKKFAIYKNHGTHWIPGSGGGKDGGYTVIPLEYVETMKGEEAVIIGNVELDIYRENPDKHSGEIDIDSLPGPILDALRRLKGWHHKSPVWFGYFPWQGELKDKKFQLQLKERTDLLEKENKKLEEEINKALNRATKYSDSDRHAINTYDNRGYNKDGNEGG